VPANKVGMYQALFRKEPEGKIQSLIVDMLKRSPPVTKSEITKELEPVTLPKAEPVWQRH